MRTRWRGRHSKAGIVMVAAMLGAVCAMVWVALVPMRYSATATLFVSRTGPYLVELDQQDRFLEQTSRSFASLATAPAVLEPVIERLHLPTSADALAKQISVTNPADTTVLKVSVSDAAPARAVAIADAVARSLRSTAAGLMPRSGDATAKTMQIIELASAQRALAPPLPLAVLLGLGAGALAGALVLAARAAVRRRPPPGGGLAAASLLPGV